VSPLIQREEFLRFGHAGRTGGNYTFRINYSQSCPNTFPTGVIPSDCSRKEVLKDLSPRTEQVLYVSLAEKKAEPSWQQHDILDKLMPKWLRP
jgi:hypothetical protein